MHGPDFAFGTELDGDEAATCIAFDLETIEFRLQRFHLGFDFGGLLHQAHEVGHVATCLDPRRPLLAQKSSSVSSGLRCAPNAEVSSIIIGSVGLSSLSAGGSALGPVLSVSRWRTATISAPGKRVRTACTNGSARTPVSNSACLASF